MTLTLYDIHRSGHSHRVRLAAGLMGIGLKLISVSDMEGGRKGSEFLSINPLGQVPALDDRGVILTDSLAIIRYLAEHHALSSAWIPDEPHERAQLDSWFGIASGLIYLGPNRARLIKLMNAKFNYDEALLASTRLFNLMDTHLAGRQWLVGTNPSLADIACYSYIAVAHEGELTLKPYPEILKWLKAMRRLDGFVEMPIRVVS